MKPEYLIIGAILLLVAFAAYAISKKDKRKQPETLTLTLPDVTLTPDTPHGRVVLGADQIDPDLQWVNRPDSRLSLRCTLRLDDYLVNNPRGHMAILLRQDEATVSTRNTGSGVAIGHLSGHPDLSADPPSGPVCVYESFGNAVGERNLFSECMRPVQDGHDYPLLIESELRATAKRSRVVIGNFDSGWFDDPNTGWDEGVNDSILIAHVFAGGGQWAIRLRGVSVEWSDTELAPLVPMAPITGGTA